MLKFKTQKGLNGQLNLFGLPLKLFLLWFAVAILSVLMVIGSVTWLSLIALFIWLGLLYVVFRFLSIRLSNQSLGIKFPEQITL